MTKKDSEIRFYRAIILFLLLVMAFSFICIYYNSYYNIVAIAFILGVAFGIIYIEKVIKA